MYSPLMIPASWHHKSPIQRAKSALTGFKGLSKHLYDMKECMALQAKGVNCDPFRSFPAKAGLRRFISLPHIRTECRLPCATRIRRIYPHFCRKLISNACIYLMNLFYSVCQKTIHGWPCMCRVWRLFLNMINPDSTQSFAINGPKCEAKKRRFLGV